jgi:hypothetical protein
MKSVVFVSLLLLLGIVAASAQTNPVPFIDQPLVPTAPRLASPASHSRLAAPILYPDR